MTKDAVSEMIVRLLGELEDDTDIDIPERVDLDTPLFGTKGILDSLALVNLIVALEQALEEEHDVIVSLADERALSQRQSPYRTIGTLADYVVRTAAATG